MDNWDLTMCFKKFVTIFQGTGTVSFMQSRCSFGGWRTVTYFCGASSICLWPMMTRNSSEDG